MTKAQKIFLLIAFLVFAILAFFAGIDSAAKTLPAAPNPQWFAVAAKNWTSQITGVGE